MDQRKHRIRTVIADDSRTALLAISRYLDLEENFDIVATAVDGLQLLDEVKRCRPDLVLVDLIMPVTGGLQAATELRKTFPELRIIVFSGLKDNSLRDECLRCGADSFAEKGQMPEKLMEEVHKLFPNNPPQK